MPLLEMSVPLQINSSCSDQSQVVPSLIACGSPVHRIGRDYFYSFRNPKEEETLEEKPPYKYNAGTGCVCCNVA